MMHPPDPMPTPWIASYSVYAIPILLPICSLRKLMKSKCGSVSKMYFLSWNLVKVQKPNNNSEEAEAGQHLQCRGGRPRRNSAKGGWGGLSVAPGNPERGCTWGHCLQSGILSCLIRGVSLWSEKNFQYLGRGQGASLLNWRKPHFWTHVSGQRNSCGWNSVSWCPKHLQSEKIALLKAYFLVFQRCSPQIWTNWGFHPSCHKAHF